MVLFQGGGSTEGFRIMHIVTTQTRRVFVVFIHLLLIKNAFLRLEGERSVVGGEILSAIPKGGLRGDGRKEGRRGSWQVLRR